MDFDISEPQKLFQTELRRALATASPLTEARRLLERGTGFSERGWTALAEQGALGAAIPERWGGVGAGLIEQGLAAEEAGRVLAPVPLASSIHGAAQLLLLAGDDALRGEFLPALADGSLIGSVGDAGTAAEVRGGRVYGRIPLVPDGLAAGLLLVRTDDAIALVPLAAEAQRRALRGLDPSKPVAEIVLEGAPCTLLAEGSAADALWEQWRDRAAMLAAFEQLGGAEAALEAARLYTLQRTSFARPIASYQAVSHRLVEMWTRIQLARVHAHYAAWSLETGTETALAAATARLAATDAFLFAAKESLHLHGGLGFTWEADCQLFFRRARHLAAQLGGAPFWQDRLVQALETRNGPA